MGGPRLRAFAAGVLVLALLAAACGDDDGGDGAPTTGDCDSVDSVSLQLQWFVQAQFAGYFAADDQRFYADQCLDVEIVEAGADIVNIAQVFQRSGTLQVSFAEDDITTVADFEGRTIGNWGFGNEYEIFAALAEEGLDPATDVELVQQDFDMSGLLSGDIDAAEAMTYNEYAQVLEAVKPDTGELYQPDDFNVISYEEVGVGMLQDAIWADGTRLGDEEYRDIAERFFTASLQGWAYCRDNVEECRDIVIARGSRLGASHQLWQMNEINKLIWPAESGVGFIDQAAWDRTVDLALNTPNLEGATVLTEPADPEAFTNDIIETAHADLEELDVDITGGDFLPIEGTLEEGGA